MEESPQILNSEELARYSRHILLEEIGVSGQELLKQSQALVIGAGGLGSPAAMYLAAAGVGRIGIADFDKVELHNLQRQLLHGTGDVDREKTHSAKERLQDINPHTEIEIHDAGITPENAMNLFSKYDVIVDGSDNFSTRYLNNDASFLAGKPLIYGSIFKFEGQVSVFNNAGGSPCYRCLFPDPPPPGTVPNCGEAGVLGALCGIVGSMQALEAIKLIADFGESLAGSLLVVDTLSMRTRKLSIKKDPQCPLCGESPTINDISEESYEFSCETEPKTATKTVDSFPLEIDVSEAKRTLDKGSVAALLDVREPYECAIGSIEGSTNIPMNAIPQNLESISKEGVLLIYCHHGGRSMQVTHFLRQNGFENAVNIAGGIDAWSAEIDSSIQRY
ncbi:MAG TPA: molybdenum cofactor biosynthesis protein MoeB [Opitutae bacterium]|nr:molybdenum cofactor biosynthesis protein MoeB [Opitutae bacterium]